jgi:hypothetical protein
MQFQYIIMFIVRVFLTCKINIEVSINLIHYLLIRLKKINANQLLLLISLIKPIFLESISQFDQKL